MTLLLAACAPAIIWDRPGTSREEFDRDVLQCKYEAEKATASYSAGATAYGVGAAAAQGIGEGLEIGRRQGDIAMSCMRARGYKDRPAR